MATPTASEKLLKVFRHMDTGKTGTVDLMDFMATMRVLGEDQFSEHKLKVMLEISEADEDDKVNYEVFLNWLFGRRQQSIAMSVATAALLKQLLKVEGNRTSEHHIVQKLESKGCCIIASVMIEGTDSISNLTIYGYLRALFALNVWSSDVRLVKSDGSRFFIYATGPAVALKAAMQMRMLTEKFSSWLDGVLPARANLKMEPTCSIGVSNGSIVLIEGDCYGDPVNVASKLGEDIAEPGQMLMSISCMLDDDSALQDLIKQMKKTERKEEISKATLHFFVLEPLPSCNEQFKKELHFPDLEETNSLMDNSPHGDMEQAKMVVLTTDLSGFTRLTKEYGILHFLRLVLKKRATLVPVIQEHAGRKIKYEGDNVIGVFPNADKAVCALAKFWEVLSDYNKSRSKDFQIRAAFGLGLGDVAILGHDMVGDGFDKSFRLAEDEAKPFEILIDADVKAQGWPSLEVKYELSEAREVTKDDKPWFNCFSLSFDSWQARDAR